MICNSVEEDADVGKLYISPPALVSLVVAPLHDLELRPEPDGHCAKSIM